MKILMLTQWFEPEPAFKGLSLARIWRDLGHEVQVITGFPNYPGGKIYDGYKVTLFQRESIDGVSILRVPLYPSHDNNPVRRILNYCSFSFTASTIGLPLIKRPDVTYVYHAPPTVGLPAVLLLHLKNVPFIYDINDLWPESLRASRMLNNKRLLSFTDTWCNFLYRQATRIVVVSPGYKRQLIKRNVPADKVSVIYNWCQDDILRPKQVDSDLTKSLKLDGRFNVVFAGNMGKAQALETVLEAARIMRERFPDIQFVFVGSGVEADGLKTKALDLSLQNVLFIDRMPMDKVIDVLNLADVLLVHLKDDPLFRITIPSKIQAYMSVGRPILVGVRGDAASLVKEAGAGLACIPEDPDDIAQKISALYEMSDEDRGAMGQNGRRYYLENLSQTIGAAKFEQIFQEVMRA